MNSRKAKRDADHKKATEMAREMRCLYSLQYGCHPCHWPTHRGMGSGKAGWEPGEWVPLTPRTHHILDQRWDCVEGKQADLEAERERIITRLEREAPRHWRRMEELS